ncbi:MAG: CvpA family protein [Bacteroidota bacterium]|nr:CvpA family protein [Bacteroidota bacterium]
MNILDILIGIPLAWSVIKGFTRGFVYEITAFVGLILGVFLAINSSGVTADFLAEVFHWTGRAAWLASLLITFAVVVLGIKLLGQVMEKVVESLAMGPLNHIAGALIAGLKTAFIISLFIYLINLVDLNHKLISEPKRDNSALWNPVSDIAPYILPQLEKRIEGLKDKKK